MKKVINIIFIMLGVLLLLLMIAFYTFDRMMMNSFNGNIGTLGCIADMDSNAVSPKNLIQFRETFPEYNVPIDLKALKTYRSLDYDHLDLSTYYIYAEEPTIYFVQWKENCSNLRFIFYPTRNETITNFRKSKRRGAMNNSEINQVKIDHASQVISEEIIPKLKQISTANNR